MFQLIACKGLVRIGEGRKDNAPGIFTDEKLGSWAPDSIPTAIALDPIDGTTLTAKGLPGAISVLAIATCDDPDDDPRRLFPAIASHYMEKLAVGPQVAADGSPVLDAPIEANLQVITASPIPFSSARETVPCGALRRITTSPARQSVWD